MDWVDLVLLQIDCVDSTGSVSVVMACMRHLHCASGMLRVNKTSLAQVRNARRGIRLKTRLQGERRSGTYAGEGDGQQGHHQSTAKMCIH